MLNRLFSPRRRGSSDEAEAPADDGVEGACPNGRCQLKSSALAPDTAPCPNGVAHAPKSNGETQTAVFALG